jgi:hydroxyethylthiazole kinase
LPVPIFHLVFRLFSLPSIFDKTMSIITQLPRKTAENLRKIRAGTPLVHNITNFVVMNYTANVLLALGASPVMAHAAGEVEEMVGLAGSLVLNIGTLTDRWVEAMVLAGRRATVLGRPIILDPVGAGATALRTAAARRILAETRVSVVRGNASEVLSLGDAATAGRGVDAVHAVDEAVEVAGRLATSLQTTLAVTGEVDLVTDGERAVRIANGHPLMTAVTGTGCSATAIIGAFLAVDPDPLSAAATGLACFNIAGEMGGEKAVGPGTFMINLLDALYNLRPEEAAERGRFSIA